MLKVCHNLKIKSIVLPELSDIYYGFETQKTMEILLSECE